MMIRKLCLIYIFSFVSNTSLQTILAFWVLVFHLICHLHYEPYEYQTVDDMERASLATLCLTLQLSFLFEWVSLDHAETQYVIYGYMLTAAILILNIAVLLWMVLIILREAYTNIQKYIRDNRTWIDETFSEKYPRIHSFLIYHEYPMPPTVVAIDIKGEAVS